MTYRLDNKYKEDSNLVLECNDALTLKKLPSNSITLTVTSPPYNIGKSVKTRVSINEYLETQKLVIEELIRVLTNDAVYYVGKLAIMFRMEKSTPLDIFFYKIFKDHGLQLRNRIIWHFGHGLHANKRFSGRYETILWFMQKTTIIFLILIR